MKTLKTEKRHSSDIWASWDILLRNTFSGTRQKLTWIALTQIPLSSPFSNLKPFPLYSHFTSQRAPICSEAKYQILVNCILKEVLIAQNLFCAIAAYCTKPFLLILWVFIRITGVCITWSFDIYKTPIQRRFDMSGQR